MMSAKQFSGAMVGVQSKRDPAWRQAEPRRISVRQRLSRVAATDGGAWIAMTRALGPPSQLFTSCFRISTSLAVAESCTVGACRDGQPVVDIPPYLPGTHWCYLRYETAEGCRRVISVSLAPSTGLRRSRHVSGHRPQRWLLFTTSLVPVPRSLHHRPDRPFGI